MESKLYHGAPFGSQMARFDVSGIHPNNKVPGTFTQVCYSKKAMSNLQRRLAPGVYDVGVGDFSEKTLSKKASAPGWKEGMTQKRNSELPHLLYRKEWFRRKDLIRRMGPGKYNVEKYDFIKDLNEKPRSTVSSFGIKEKRFRGWEPRDVFPGPGNYGIPHEILENKEKISPGNVGLLDSGTFGRYLPTVGCHLAPGRYNIESDKDKIYNVVISKKGPYDVFSEDRTEGQKTGHYATRITYNLSPGEYDLNSFIDDLNKWPKDKHGKFGKLSQYPFPPAERIYFSTLSQTPNVPLFPSPTAYDPEKAAHPIQNTYPFLLKSKRFDRRSNLFFTGNANSIGPGRYDVHRWRKAQHSYSCSHAFNTQSSRFFTGRQDLYMRERLRVKDRNVAERSFSSYSDTTGKQKSAAPTARSVTFV